ncbi:MAG: hypothetical protein FJX76_27600 [Armatimonadetes bacterium]|nr:hypothetical protein [Armatimonadota bacterium]
MATYGDRRKPTKERVQSGGDKEVALVIASALIRNANVTQVDDAIRIYNDVLEATRPRKGASE